MYSVNDINWSRLNSITPTLQRMEDDPLFLEHRRHRFDSVPPPPYSSGSITQFPTPGPFPAAAQVNIDLDEVYRKPLSDKEKGSFRRMRYYHPCCRYEDEVRFERDRIDREYRRRDEYCNPLYHGPDLIGRSGQRRFSIMARNSIKKRWERLGVWNPEWGIPDRVNREPKDCTIDWKWRWECTKPHVDRYFSQQPLEFRQANWPSREEEVADERAVRVHLERQGCWDEALVSQNVHTENPTEPHVDDHEFLITSRPWYVWQLEVREEEIRLRRCERDVFYHAEARENVTERWKEKGYWKENWPSLAGWKWKHESPSPEPVDPNEIDFTSSEIDAMEEIPPPTPPKIILPTERREPTWSRLFGYLPGYDPNNPHEPIHNDLRYRVFGDEDDTNNGPDITSQSNSNDEILKIKNDDASHVKSPTAEQMTISTRHHTRSASRAEKSLPATSRSKSSNGTSRALPRSTKICRPDLPVRRSSRIAERQRQSKGAEPHASKEEDLASQSKPFKRQSRQKPMTSPRVTRSKRHLPIKRCPPSKARRVAKR